MNNTIVLSDELNQYDNITANDYNLICNNEAIASASPKYKVISTKPILDTLHANNWSIDSVTVKNSKANAGYQSHMVRLFNPDYITDTDRKEIIVCNSYDRLSRLKIYFGSNVFACSNGLVTGNWVIEPFIMRHMGNIKEMLSAMLTDINGKVNQLHKYYDILKNTYITEQEKLIFATDCVKLRHDITKDIINPDQILEPVRVDDIGSTVYKVMNVVQEKLITGNYDVNTKVFDDDGIDTGKLTLRKPRKLSGITNNISINTGISDITDRMVNIKYLG